MAKLLNTKEAAEILGICEQVLTRKVRDVRIKAFVTTSGHYRFSLRDILDYRTRRQQGKYGAPNQPIVFETEVS